MEKYIHQQNLALFKRRLAEPHTDAEREVLIKLLTEEQAKDHHRTMELSSHVDLHQSNRRQD